MSHYLEFCCGQAAQRLRIDANMRPLPASTRALQSAEETRMQEHLCKLSLACCSKSPDACYALARGNLVDSPMANEKTWFLTEETYIHDNHFFERLAGGLSSWTLTSFNTLR